MLTIDTVRGLHRLGMIVTRGRGAPEDPGRRAALARVAGGVAAAVTMGAGTSAVASALGRVAVKNVEVPLARLPRELDGTVLVQITDLHLGALLGRHFMEEIVARVNKLQPDVVAITGDLVDGNVADLGDAVATLAKLQARYGVYFVTGNHEYYAGVAEWLPELALRGVRVLRNERVSIGQGAASFDLAGIDDFRSRGRAPGHGPDLPGALAGRDPRRELVLLAHQPRAVHEAAALGVGLQLSGHTHGGQIWPWCYAVYLDQGFIRGLAHVGDTWLYVSCGTGFVGPAMRLLAPSEITRVVLRAGAGEARVTG